MGRRKALRTVPLQSGGTYGGWSSVGICSREDLLQKYNQALTETRPTTLYADTTEAHLKRMEKIFTEYCSIFDLQPRETLRKCETARMENFLHWVVRVYTITKTSSVTTYWRQLSQLHITWWQCRISPQVLKQIFVFIEGSLTAEYGLDNIEADPKLLEADDFVEVIQYHWAADINLFPNERQRVQVAAILLLAAYTGSRPGALLQITYRDLRLYVEKHRKTGKHELKLAVTLTKTKSGQKRKRPKTYIFHLDDNPLFCIITHMSSIAFDDKAYGVPELISPRILFALKAKKGPSQVIPWKQEMLDIPIFRRAIIKSKQGVHTSPKLGLTYRQYHGWVTRLGEALGFVQTLTTYCLRRALGNAINDDPNSNAAVRNLVLDHGPGSRIFERNYLSRNIRYFTQDAYWGVSSDPESAKTGSQIGLLRDPDRPKKLSPEQRQRVREDLEVQELAAVRDHFCDQIEDEFGVVEMAKGEPIYHDYKAVLASLVALIRRKERALLRQIQEEYDAKAPVLAIQQQLNGDCSDTEEEDDEGGTAVEATHIRIVERRYIAEFAMRDRSAFSGQKGYPLHIEFSVHIIALCRRRDRRQVKTRQSPEPASIKKRPNSPQLPQIEPVIKRDQPLQCQGLQCLFCLAETSLPIDEQQRKYKRKYTLQKHLGRCRLNEYGPDDPISCPDPACAGLIVNGKNDFKGHLFYVHGCCEL